MKVLNVFQNRLMSKGLKNIGSSILWAMIVINQVIVYF